MSGGRRSSRTYLKCCLVVFVVASALYISEPALFSRITKGFKEEDNASSCAPCTCDCPPSSSIVKIATGLANLTVTECGKDDPELNKELKKQFVDRLTEELNLQKTVAEEHSRHMNVSYLAARRLASQYEREAEKCNTATETCEEARERTEALLIKERKVTSLWERRALKLGWTSV